MRLWTLPSTISSTIEQDAAVGSCKQDNNKIQLKSETFLEQFKNSWFR